MVGFGDDFDPFHDEPDEPDEVDSSVSAPPEERWYHGRLDRAQSEERLKQFGKLGSYLIRESDRRPGSYVLSYLGRSGVSHFKITAVCGDFYIGGRQFSALSDLVGYYTTGSGKLPRYIMGGRTFSCLDAVINRYKTEQILEGHTLGNPVSKRTKPRGVIDLNCSYLYQVDESFFERPHCFQLVERELPCLATVTYLCSDAADTTADWMAVLRPLCIPQMTGSPKLSNVKFMKSLHLTIMQASRLPSKIVPMPYCLVSLNQVKTCRTRPKPGPDPVWDEEFILDDIPTDVVMVTVVVYNMTKRGKDSEVAEVVIELDSLPNGEEVEEWHQLTGITPVGDWGAIRLRYRYFHDLIMPCEEYNSLKELLLDPNLEAVQALADVSHRDRLPLATSLLRIFRNERREHDLLQRLTENEIEKEHETSTLFRAASLTTTLLDLYMKSTCTEFLNAAILDTIFRMLESKQSCELNPTKMDNPNDACANAELLLRVLDDITSSIFNSASACPMPLRYICGCLQRKVREKWPHDRFVRARVVSGFIFLRLICPAILNPRQFHLLQEPPHPVASRSLIMIAKCLQNLANLIEFGGKEPYMEVVNPFILKNRERMINYLDMLSNVTERPEIEEVRTKSEPSRELAQLHHICVSHLPDLINKAKTQLHTFKNITNYAYDFVFLNYSDEAYCKRQCIKKEKKNILYYYYYYFKIKKKKKKKIMLGKNDLLSKYCGKVNGTRERIGYVDLILMDFLKNWNDVNFSQSNLSLSSSLSYSSFIQILHFLSVLYIKVKTKYLRKLKDNDFVKEKVLSPSLCKN
ncbi:Ras GTPase-activating protein 1 [Armadillidium nasatum]|uniref:Ras GTPase-activating protein 1 n=1 Tax=Armadillidium nasatum TaxID=96803 RepID=A0A5N5T770_9CRUS|nr:Ras GTPase-activating protein 1 [Armadillidium nasatum]